MFSNFSKLLFVFAFWLIRNIYSGDAHHANYWKDSLNHHFQYCTQCISDLQRFEIFRNSSFFSTFWLLRNFYSCDAHHANYGKHSFNHHFQQSAHSVYEIYSVLKPFKIAVCFTHLAFTKFLLRWCAPWKLWWTLLKSSFPTLDTLCRLDLQCFPTFRNCSLFCTFLLLRNFYFGDAPHGNYGEHCSSHHFRHWTHTVQIRFTAFSNFSKLQFVLHIFAFTKFLLLWCTSC